MKGILLCGGKGSRVEPLTTQYTNKHLIPINGKLMVQYPMETLKLLGVDEILIVTNPESCSKFVDIFKDGKEFGVKIYYGIQSEPDGVLGSLKVAKPFVENDKNFFVALGDNKFDVNFSKSKIKQIQKADYLIFIKHLIKNAKEYGCLTTFGITEKPQIEEGDVVTGLYKFPSYIYKFIDKFVKSSRFEYEIVDLHNHILSKYVKTKEEHYVYLKDKDNWQDLGSISAINDLNNERM